MQREELCANKDVCLITFCNGEEEGRIQEVFRMYRAQVRNQAASHISSSGKVLECLVSRQGLGRKQILTANPVLIFGQAVRRSATSVPERMRGCTVVDPRFAALGLEAPAPCQWWAKWLSRAARATSSGGPALTVHWDWKLHNSKVNKLENATTKSARRGSSVSCWLLCWAFRRQGDFIAQQLHGSREVLTLMPLLKRSATGVITEFNRTDLGPRSGGLEPLVMRIACLTRTAPLCSRNMTQVVRAIKPAHVRFGR